MITPYNFTHALQTIDIADINEVINGNKDFIKLELHTFNIGAYATIEEVDYDEEEQESVTSNGNLYCDKDEFLRLIEETQAFEI